MKKKLNDETDSNSLVFIKKIWGNKRYRSILFLGLYFVFFFIIITNLKEGYNNNQKQIDNKENIVIGDILRKQYNELGRYNYIISINNDEIITGSIDDSYNEFSYNNHDYMIIFNDIYLKNDDDLKKININRNSKVKVPIESLMPDKIISYVINQEPTYEGGKEIYKIIYSIPGTYFGIDDEYEFDVTINGDSKIREVELDLTGYVNEDYVIKIEMNYN